ncbi:MAG: hypothetical protein IAE80_12160 [Anaerolinea sp.]|nr:hypothetical protein [Anaerolinea sp.]
MIEQVGIWLGFVLTLMVFSYLLGDNLLYRLAIYVFIGLAAGFVTMVTVESVLLPWFRAAISTGDTGNLILGVIPLIFGAFLLLRMTKRFQGLGTLVLALIIGVGTAVALVGAISGTLLPLADTTANAPGIDALNGFILVIGVISTLIYFQYLARRTPGGTIRRGLVPRTIGAVGQGFIAVTLGAVYGSAILTGLVVFSERVAFLLNQIGGG